MLEDAKFLGLTNFEDLLMFKQREQRNGETLGQALKRFRLEVENEI